MIYTPMHWWPNCQEETGPAASAAQSLGHRATLCGHALGRIGISESIRKGEGGNPLTAELMGLGEHKECASSLPPKPQCKPSTRSTPPCGKKEEAVAPFSLQTLAAMTPRTPAWQELGGAFQRPGVCANQAR